MAIRRGRRADGAPCAPRPKTGRPAKLTAAHWQVPGQRLRRGAMAAGLATEDRTLRRIEQVIRRQFGVTYHCLKTIDDFTFTYQSTLRLALLGSALSPDFVTEGRALVLVGKPGRGKAHLAITIAYRAIQHGFTARFVTAAELIDDLSAAVRGGRLADALTAYTHPDVLVVDEVGDLTYGTDAANMLFHVVNDRHRRKRAMLFTTNKPPGTWGHVLHDDDLAQAIVDRVLERGRLLTLDGSSLRTKHLGLDEPPAAGSTPPMARLSGIRAPGFPQPTPLLAQPRGRTPRLEAP